MIRSSLKLSGPANTMLVTRVRTSNVASCVINTIRCVCRLEAPDSRGSPTCGSPSRSPPGGVPSSDNAHMNQVISRHTVPDEELATCWGHGGFATMVGDLTPATCTDMTPGRDLATPSYRRPRSASSSTPCVGLLRPHSYLRPLRSLNDEVRICCRSVIGFALLQINVPLLHSHQA